MAVLKITGQPPGGIETGGGGTARILFLHFGEAIALVGVAPIVYHSEVLLHPVAAALEVLADALLSDKLTSLKDMELLKKFEVIQEVTGEPRQVVMAFLDMVIRDYKTKQAYNP